MQYSGCYKKIIVIFILLNITIIPYDLYAGDYIESNINLSLSIGLLTESNDIIQKEEDMTFDNAGDSSGPATYVLNGACQLDLLTPPVITIAEGKFVIKAGMIGRVGFCNYEHSFTYNDEEISESIIEYDYWQIGPSVLFAFHHRIFDAGGVLYTYYGLISGDVHAAAGLREAGFSYSDSDCETGITGKKFNIGIRNFCALNKGFPIFGGVGCYYTRTDIVLNHKLPVYGNAVGKDVTSHGFGLELFLGIYF